MLAATTNQSRRAFTLNLALFAASLLPGCSEKPRQNDVSTSPAPEKSYSPAFQAILDRLKIESKWKVLDKKELGPRIVLIVGEDHSKSEDSYKLIAQMQGVLKPQIFCADGVFGNISDPRNITYYQNAERIIFQADQPSQTAIDPNKPESVFSDIAGGKLVSIFKQSFFPLAIGMETNAQLITDSLVTNYLAEKVWETYINQINIGAPYVGINIIGQPISANARYTLNAQRYLEQKYPDFPKLEMQQMRLQGPDGTIVLGNSTTAFYDFLLQLYSFMDRHFIDSKNKGAAQLLDTEFQAHGFSRGIVLAGSSHLLDKRLTGANPIQYYLAEHGVSYIAIAQKGSETARPDLVRKFGWKIE